MTKVLLDTSVLVAATVQKHSSHLAAFSALDRVQSGKDEGLISAHSLCEMYAVLTKIPFPFRHTPEQALLNIEENVLPHFETVALTRQDYPVLIREAAMIGIQGGTIYDALLLKCALKSGAGILVTLNTRHFQAIVPKGLTLKIAAP